MKCPKCWTERAYVRQVAGFKGSLLKCLLLVPMRCRHCYHEFVVSRFATIGQQIHPPVSRIEPTGRRGHRKHRCRDRQRNRARRTGVA